METDAWTAIIGLAAFLSVGFGTWMLRIATQLSKVIVKLDEVLDRTEQQGNKLQNLEIRVATLERVNGERL